MQMAGYGKSPPTWGERFLAAWPGAVAGTVVEGLEETARFAVRVFASMQRPGSHTDVINQQIPELKRLGKDDVEAFKKGATFYRDTLANLPETGPAALDAAEDLGPEGSAKAVASATVTTLGGIETGAGLVRGFSKLVPKSVPRAGAAEGVGSGRSWQDFLPEAERRVSAARAASGGIESYAMAADESAKALQLRLRTGTEGRVESAFAKIEPQHLGTGTRTTASSRQQARGLGLATDDAGHLVANRLGGPGGQGFVVPQSPKVNRGAFRDFEAGIARDVLAGKDVFVRVIPRYGADATRPFEILYQVRVDGTTRSVVFPNPR